MTLTDVLLRAKLISFNITAVDGSWAELVAEYKRDDYYYWFVACNGLYYVRILKEGCYGTSKKYNLTDAQISLLLLK